jgi:hypothetical protein
MNLVDLALSAIAAGCYFAGYYELAFWTLTLAILNGCLALGRSIANPGWYMTARMQLGLDPGNGLTELIVTKVVATVAGIVAAWWLAVRAGYVG